MNSKQISNEFKMGFLRVKMYEPSDTSLSALAIQTGS